MKETDFYSLRFFQGQFDFIDQTKLPFEEIYVQTQEFERIAEAIERLEIRGAPAIGLAAAYGVALSQKDGYSPELFTTAFHRLARTRPTAVNLFWALEEMKLRFEQISSDESAYEYMICHANRLFNEDVAMCDAIAENGAAVFKGQQTVLTHCNTGKLAMGGGGTALYVVKRAFEQGKVKFVYADETRPLLQGSRLTAYELQHYGIPYAVISDNMAGHIMKTEQVDIVITGADRITANGDSANKIGTYALAVLCKYHGIPFYIAAPSSTIDMVRQSGSEIVIEERNKEELYIGKNGLLTNPEFSFRNPAFDVTPAELITGIITEAGVFHYPYHFT